ncbi:MAG TPA: AAA family ATPase [Caldilineaceae bacterium]|nr:AAA family ATPase [Caldilineaceae bacterium]
MLTFAEWVRQRRKALDLTQAMLAERVSCAVITIKKIEQEMRRPSRELAELLADHLAIPPQEREAFLRLARGEYIETLVRYPETPPPVEPPAVESAPPIVCVAREPELAQLEAHLVATLHRSGRIVFITGEAGQGKTTLLAEFARRAQQQISDLVVANGNCDAYAGVGDPYLPFRDLIAQLTGDVNARGIAGTLPQEQARRLWAALPRTIEALLDHGPDLLDLFVSTAELRSRLASADAQVGASWARLAAQLAERQTPLAPPQQRQVFEQMTQVLYTLAARHPLLLILDDLHWTDRASAALLFHLGRRLGNSRILILGAYRPSEVHLEPLEPDAPESAHPLVPVLHELKRRYGDIEIDLGHTANERRRAFVDALLDQMPNRLDEEFRTTLFQHTRGHPLFTVELLRELFEQKALAEDETGAYVEAAAIEWTTLPARVEAVIAHRIGRLPAALQEALQVASVEGETFTAEVVAQVKEAAPAQLIRQLSSVADRQHRLVQSLASERVGGRLRSPYRFRHILFQKYLYNSLDPAERTYLHEAVGHALEEIFAGETEPLAVQLAYHFEMAGLTAKAIEYLCQAAERATRFAAYEEPIAHLNRGLSLLRKLPVTPERARQELRLQILLGVSMVAAKGWSAPEVQRAYERANALAQQVGELEQLVGILFGHYSFSHVGGNVQTSLAIGRHCLKLLKEQDDAALQVAGHFMTLSPLIHQGEFRTARLHAQHSLAAYGRLRRPFPLATFTMELGIFTLAYDAHGAWYLGNVDTALAECRQAVILARDLSHPFSLVVAEAYLAMLHGFRREWSQAERWIASINALSAVHGFPYYRAWAAYLLGWALAEQGELAQGIARMEEGMAEFRAMRTGLRQSFYLAHLGMAQARAGDPATGLHLLAEALDAAHQSGERCHEAEIWRLRGEVCAMQGESAEIIEGYYLRAIAIAQQQEAKSLELRAAVSLARLWQGQGRRAAAVQRLAPVYEWFTEGFETPDLQEATALLDELR